MPIVQTDVAYTSQINADTIQRLNETYPFLEVEEIGKSVLGKAISCIKLGNGPQKVFYNAAFHANEWITTPILLRFAEEVAAAYATRGRLYGIDISRLLRKVTLYLVPMVNPDGVDLVNGAITDENVLRRVEQIADDYPGVPYPTGWKANIHGVDLNLQFPARWEMARRIKFEQGFTTFAPRDFVGEGPLTEPESLAVYNFTLQQDFDLILAYHSQGEVIYWKFLDYEPPRSREIALYFGEVSGYTVEETPEVSGYAGYKDWFIQDYNRPGYTIEVGQGINPLPVTQFQQIYGDNIGILLGAMTEI
ncbi:MAG: M14 family metallocarboxypeptidase [Roseburia sp.]|nr:M14 family metallocarboxypeptidase [Roseburia sp.]